MIIDIHKHNVKRVNSAITGDTESSVNELNKPHDEDFDDGFIAEVTSDIPCFSSTSSVVDDMKSGIASNNNKIVTQEENQDVSKTDKGGTSGCLCAPTKVDSSVKYNTMDIDAEESDELHSSTTSDNNTEEDQKYIW